MKIKMLKEGTDAGGLVMAAVECGYSWKHTPNVTCELHGRQLLGNFLIISKAPVIWGGAGDLGWHTAGVNRL